MCGIAGYLNLSGAPASADIARNMAAVLRHRGPDGLDAHADGPAALGHVRLSILDLTDAGRQPMSTPDGLQTIVHNGEIYNHADLRKELVALGHVFSTRTDTEVLLHAWREWGPECLPRLNGMFAFCVLDIRRRALFLARDRYGVKPLYYGRFGNVLLFASEAKAFLAHPAFRAAPDFQALTEYLTFQNILSDRTFFADVRLAPAGCCGRIPLDGADGPAFSRWWDFDFREAENPPSPEEAGEELSRLFRQAVRRQLMGDVEIGAYLSGGVDSGSIAAVAAAEMGYLKTFTCGFDLRSVSGMELSFDERARAEELSSLFGTEHYEVVLKAGDMERVMPALAWHMEEPRLGQSYPNFYAARLASRFVRAAFSGCGGDELFAGYPWRYYRVLDCRDFEDYVDRYYLYWQRLIPNSLLRPLLAPVEAETRHVWTRDIFRDVFGSLTTPPRTPEECVNRSLHFEAKTFLAGLLLVEDKISMAHGLETRVPFLDNDLADFAMRLPVRLKLQGVGSNRRLDENLLGKPREFYRRHADGKRILRGMMARFAPESISSAEKQGFSAPDASWFRGQSIDYLRSLLMPETARVWEFLDRRTALGILEEHLSGRENRRLFIWSLLCVEWWMRKYL